MAPMGMNLPSWPEVLGDTGSQGWGPLGSSNNHHGPPEGGLCPNTHSPGCQGQPGCQWPILISLGTWLPSRRGPGAGEAPLHPGSVSPQASYHPVHSMPRPPCSPLQQRQVLCALHANPQLWAGPTKHGAAMYTNPVVMVFNVCVFFSHSIEFLEL